MNKYLSMAALALALLAAGCGRNLDPTCGQKEVDVSFDMDATQPAQ